MRKSDLSAIGKDFPVVILVLTASLLFAACAATDTGKKDDPVFRFRRRRQRCWCRDGGNELELVIMRADDCDANSN